MIVKEKNLMENQSVTIVNKFFEAYTKRDFEAIKQVLDENSKWIFPGQNPLSGEKKGIEEIVEFFDKMGAVMNQSNARADVLIMGANEHYMLECQHIWTNREADNLDHHWCVLWNFKDGKIAEGKHFAEDQYKVDTFFNKLA